MNSIASVNAIIDDNGGNAALSERFGISTGAISNWRKRGYIPRERLIELVATKQRAHSAPSGPASVTVQVGGLEVTITVRPAAVSK